MQKRKSWRTCLHEGPRRHGQVRGTAGSVSRVTQMERFREATGRLGAVLCEGSRGRRVQSVLSPTQKGCTERHSEGDLSSPGGFLRACPKELGHPSPKVKKSLSANMLASVPF